MASKGDLSCFLCARVSSDNAILTCTHSFCTDCLTQQWRDMAVKECPQCRRRSSMSWNPPDMSSVSPPPYTEELMQFCTGLTELGHAAGREGPTDELSLTEKEQKYVPLLTSRMKQLEMAVVRFEQADSFISEQAERTVKLIQEEFERQRQSLQQQEDSRIRAVRDEEQEKRSRLKVRMDAIREEEAAVSEMLRTAEEQTLGHSEVHTSQARRPLQEEELNLGSGALLDQAQHLGNLGFHICSRLRAEAPYFPVILDHNTANPQLSLSSDLSSVRREGENRPRTPERDRTFTCVLGYQGFSSGAHSWDVSVPMKTHWALGVSTKTPEGRLDRMWRLWYYRGKFRWWPHPGEIQPSCNEVQVGAEFQRVRVVLDVDQGELSFYAVDSQSLIYSVTDAFSGEQRFNEDFKHKTVFRPCRETVQC
uniref:Uncharacterized protein n=1 Tax=Neogobius melanostomus TaxID=47308 RepID=A0A8C6WUU1_9GOBI